MRRNISNSLKFIRSLGPSPYVVEILTPRHDVTDLEGALAEFERRYDRILGEGHIVSLPDNPLGRLHFTALEVIAFKELDVKPAQLLLHLNSFHRKADLDEMLAQADEIGVQNILCVSGDGGPRLPRLEPEELGISARSVSSVELLRYIHAAHPGRFTLGVAFNQYEPPEHELVKLHSKIEAGAAFVATQPVIGDDAAIRELLRRGLPVYLGVWMSRRVQLLEQCVGYPVPEALAGYDPAENLQGLRELYSPAGFYLSLLSFQGSWQGLAPRAGSGESPRVAALSRG